jgi:phosphoglycolate phosphatase-like HAD superfamily hydrolase
MRDRGRERRGILLDFDHTLFDTDRFFWVDLRSAFARFGVPDDAWERSYDAIWPSGYSLTKHLDELARVGAISGADTKRTMLDTLRAEFSDLRPYLFPDVPWFLTSASKRGFDLILLSFGDPSWQSYKVQASGVAPYFRRVSYTAAEQGKQGLAHGLSVRYDTLHAIDNNPADLDAMKGCNPRLLTHLICRVPPSGDDAAPARHDRFREAAKYLDIPARLSHQRCSSLSQVTL